MADNWKQIKEIANDVNEGRVSAKENVVKSLDLARKSHDFKTLIAIIEERSIKRAEEIDDRIKKGENAGRLAGVPFIAKDNFLVFGADTTAASNILKGFDAPYQSSAVEKLEAEGAICVAKANLDAFAHGSSTENSDFFTTLNPYDKTRVPGGSSGGSAAAVALDIAPFALGTDTGGSIRQPASFCGVVGFKPTYGLVSRSGVVAMGSSLDCVGPITKNVDDAAIVLDVISGKDGLDSTMVERNADDYSKLSSVIKGKKIGVVKEFLTGKVDPEVKNSINSAIKKLENAGAKINKVSLPSSEYGLPVYYIICPAEVSSNLSRYDGQRYGFSYKEAKDLDESYMMSRDKGFGEEAKRRILIGTYVLSSGYYDAYYKKAQILRTKIINEINNAFDEVDYLVGPTTPSSAFKIGENSKDPIKMYLSDLLTVIANLAGIPSISVPAGSSGGLPVGLQIMSPQHTDKELLNIAKGYESLNV